MCHECSGVYVNSVVSDLDVSYPPKFAECETRNMRVGLTLRAAVPRCPQGNLCFTALAKNHNMFTFPCQSNP